MIGNNIKRIRTARGMRQSDMADKLNVSSKTVSSWEVNRTEPNMGMIEQIAKVLNCSKSDLIGDDGVTETYYTNPETARLAQELFETPGMRILFDAARDSDPKDLQMAADLLKRLKGLDD